MSQSVLEMAKDLTAALINSGQLTCDTMPGSLQSTYIILAEIDYREKNPAPKAEAVAPQASAQSWRQSIHKHTITCLVCGQDFKQLSVRHLETHGLDSKSYRDQFGIPRTQHLAARATTQRRQEVAQAIQPWKRTPRYIQSLRNRDNGTVAAEDERATPRRRGRKAVAV